MLNVTVYRTEFAAYVLMINMLYFKFMMENTQKFLRDVMENAIKNQSAARNTVNICISKKLLKLIWLESIACKYVINTGSSYSFIIHFPRIFFLRITIIYILFYREVEEHNSILCAS